jgi:hypothetical protein
MMRWRLSKASIAPALITGELLKRIQQLATKQAKLRARIECLVAGQPVSPIGTNLDSSDGTDQFESAPWRGRAGGFARAATARRDANGIFIPSR